MHSNFEQKQWRSSAIDIYWWKVKEVMAENHENWSQAKLSALMEKLDTDGDGKITLEEFRLLFKEAAKWERLQAEDNKTVHHQKISVIVAFLKVLTIVFYCRINYIIVEVDTDFLLWNYRKRFRDITQWIFVRHIYDTFTTFNYVFTAFKVTWTVF